MDTPTPTPTPRGAEGTEIFPSALKGEKLPWGKFPSLDEAPRGVGEAFDFRSFLGGWGGVYSTAIRIE